MFLNQEIRPEEQRANPELAAASQQTRSVDELREAVVQALKTVYDPEIPVNIYELGLIYDLQIDDQRAVALQMTLTAPGCPVANEMPEWVRNAVKTVEGVGEVDVQLVWEPSWTQDMMSLKAKLELNML